jgi:hypothetical protein
LITASLLIALAGRPSTFDARPDQPGPEFEIRANTRYEDSWDTAKNAIPTGSTRIILPSGEGPRRTVIDFAATVH